MRLLSLNAAVRNKENEEMISWDVASQLKYYPVSQNTEAADVTVTRKMRRKSRT